MNLVFRRGAAAGLSGSAVRRGASRQMYLVGSHIAILLIYCAAPLWAETPKTPNSPPPKLHFTLVQVEDVPGLPRVLLIGDSVSMWYTPPVRERLKGIANVHRPPVNCHTSRQILTELDGYLGEKKWDAIHFNCGGHDFSYRNSVTYAPPPEGKINVPLDEYEKNLRLIVARLKKTGAKLVWASTTPMSEAYMQKGYRRESELFAYNAAAEAIMNEAGVPIDDLYALAKPNVEKLLKDGVHFTPAGSEFLAQAVAAAVMRELPASSLKAWRKPAAERKRRIIFNNDGNDARTPPDEPRTHENFLSKRTTALAGSQVDAIFYCTGGFNLYTHHGKDTEARTYGDANVVNWAWDLGKNGPDSLETMVRFGHEHGMEVFWSMRMNDCHDSTNPKNMSQWKKDHPQCLVGKKGIRYPAGGNRWSALNYGLPEVREKVFRILADVASRYDVDGLELDFFRSPIYFQPQILGKPVTQEHRDAMTELVRRVRRMADEEAIRRGRPLLLAVRVPDSLECARALGLDIERWLEEGLVDVMAVSCLFRLNPWETSVALGHKYGVPVYPSLSESRFKDTETNALRRTDASYRGRALEAWAAGADGIYLFNFDDPQSKLWKELGDPRTLPALEHLYTTGHTPAASGDGVNRWVAKGLQFLNLPIPMPERPLTLAPGVPASVEIRAGMRPNGDTRLGPVMQIAVRLRLQDAPANAPAIEVKLNGHVLASGVRDGQWIEYPARPEWMQRGVNRIELNLASGGKDKCIVSDLILHVKHP
ncbi:MAG: family 10 glycosylhydrolase [Pirellulales bacterium]|nr:family 10 glycosylhydrolase [Pirellulales bacterium]